MRPTGNRQRRPALVLAAIGGLEFSPVGGVIVQQLTLAAGMRSGSGQGQRCRGKYAHQQEDQHEPGSLTLHCCGDQPHIRAARKVTTGYGQQAHLGKPLPRFCCISAGR